MNKRFPCCIYLILGGACYALCLHLIGQKLQYVELNVFINLNCLEVSHEFIISIFIWYKGVCLMGCVLVLTEKVLKNYFVMN